MFPSSRGEIHCKESWKFGHLAESKRVDSGFSSLGLEQAVACWHKGGEGNGSGEDQHCRVLANAPHPRNMAGSSAQNHSSFSPRGAGEPSSGTTLTVLVPTWPVAAQKRKWGQIGPVRIMRGSGTRAAEGRERERSVPGGCGWCTLLFKTRQVAFGGTVG